MQFLPAFLGLAIFIACSKAQPGRGPPPPPPGSGPPPTSGRQSSGSGGQSSGSGGQSSGSGGQFSGSGSGGQSSGSGGQSGGSGGGQTSDCKITDSTATLPPCVAKFFKDGILIDGNNNTCNNNKPIIASKITLDELFKRGEAAVRGTGTCSSESSAPKPSGGGGQPSCGTGTGVGNCESGSYRLQSLYGEKQLDIGRLIVTNGVPSHCYKDGAEKSVNYVCEHYRALLVPNTPKNTTTFSDHPMGPCGIANSGAFLFNHLSAESTCNVAAITEKITFDTCDGHASPTCQYHYHKAPNCISGFNTCALLGYINDGFPFYGKCTLTINGVPTPVKSCYKLISGKNGCDKTHYTFDPKTPGCNLDQANGFYFTQNTPSQSGTFKAGSYAYFFTPEYPFSMPGYYGSKGQAKWCVLTV